MDVDPATRAGGAGSRGVVGRARRGGPGGGRGGRRGRGCGRQAATGRQRSTRSRSASSGMGRRSPRSTRQGRAVRPAITWLDSRARGEQAELEAATGLRGWALGVLPAARWLERHEPDAAARAALVPQLVGGARAAAERRARRRRSCRAGAACLATSWRAPGSNLARVAPGGERRHGARRADAGGREPPRAARRHPGRRRPRRRVRELPRRADAGGRRCDRRRRRRRRVRRLRGSSDRGRRRVHDARAAPGPALRRRRDGRDGGVAGLARPGHPRWLDLDRRPDRRGGRDRAGRGRPRCSCRTSPASARRSGTRPRAGRSSA